MAGSLTAVAILHPIENRCKCGLSMDRDENAAVNILWKGLQAVGLTVSTCRALVDGQALKQELLGATLEAYVTAPA